MKSIPNKDCKFSRGRRLKFKGDLMAKQRKMIRTSTMILIAGMKNKQWLGKKLENKQFGILKKDKGNEIAIFQGMGDRMVPLADIGMLQGNLDLEGGGKFNSMTILLSRFLEHLLCTQAYLYFPAFASSTSQKLSPSVPIQCSNNPAQPLFLSHNIQQDIIFQSVNGPSYYCTVTKTIILLGS